MLEQLKQLAFQKLQEKMAGNKLNDADTSSAAMESAGELLSTIKEKLAGGNLNEIVEIFSNDGRATEETNLFGDIKDKMTQILLKKGMSSDEATAEAGNVAPDLINTLKEKFLSPKEEDKDFDLGKIGEMLGGDAGDLFSKAKSLFGK
jgi:hypothetical protein